MSGRVIFVTLPSGVFGNGGQTWEGIDLEPSRASLQNRGFRVETASIDGLDALVVDEGDVIIYSSCDDPEIREYMKDVFYFLNGKCLLLPRYEFLLAYENKGFQELKKREAGMGNLEGRYHFDLDAALSGYPFVLKSVSGAGSSGVHLVKSGVDLEAMRRRLFSVGLRRRLRILFRWLSLSPSQFARYRYRHKGFHRHVVQEFIAGLDCDYKVLVFGDRYYSLKRSVRKNDFRASGSGNFDFSAPVPAQVLEFAAQVADCLDAPQLSLDIALSASGCHLVEYQAINFGPITLTRSLGHHKRSAEGWERVEGPSNLADCFAHSLDMYFSRHSIRVP